MGTFEAEGIRHSGLYSVICVTLLVRTLKVLGSPQFFDKVILKQFFLTQCIPCRCCEKKRKVDFTSNNRSMPK